MTATMSPSLKIDSVAWGNVPTGELVRRFTLSNADVELSVATYGARLTSVRTKDRHGVFGEIALGADELEPYLTDRAYLGAIVGRFANRIAKGRFTLDSKTYQIPCNDGVNTLHGGPEGFHQKVWDAKVLPDGVAFSCTSPDGEMGYPGALDVRVLYRLNGNELSIEYAVTTDRPTCVNLTNHVYWNLSGKAGEVGDHILRLNAAAFTPSDATLIPTGVVESVSGTALDFREPTSIGRRWNSEEEAIRFSRGYDHNWVLPVAAGKSGNLQLAAELSEPTSGRKLSVLTTEPGIQFYSGNFLDGSFTGRNGVYEKRFGLCLETQHFPDSPNQPDFPSTRIDAQTPYRSVTKVVFR